MKVKWLFIALLLANALCLTALDDKSGTSGFSFLKLQFSARAAGMANAFTGLSNDADAVFYNTAGLVNCSETHFKATFINYINGMNGGSAVYTQKIDDVWSVAPFVQFLVSDDIDETVESGHLYEKIGTFHTSHIVAGVGFARKIHEVVDFGINAKYFYENLYDDCTATALAFDFSVHHQTENEALTVGGTLKNVGTQLSYYTEEQYKENMPLTAVVGAAYNFFDKGYINLDICRPFDSDFFGKFGLEYYHNTYLTLRGGLDTRMQDYKTNDDLDFLSGVALGFGINWNQYVIDYATYSMGSFGFVNQIAVSVKF
ncbi:MAG: PorV/PorQ family protein [Candidatus Cloacimonetes bacterium]|nr:PorV/PorQ family protein [Candidatus Cloacimonadota bacterium]